MQQIFYNAVENFPKFSIAGPPAGKKRRFLAPPLRSMNLANLLSSISILLLLCLLLLLISTFTDASVHVYDDPEVECCKNPPAGDEHGKVHQIATLCAYVSGNPHSKAAVILLSDVWGYGVPKLRKVADKVASAGYYVVVPDLFFGDPTTNTTKKEVWLANHRPEQAVKYVKPLIQVLKKKGISKIGAAGFCWGGKVVVELAKEADKLQVAALLHPSYVTLDDIKGVKVSIAILVGELDKGTPPEFIKESTAALKAKPQVDYFVKVYPGMPHGWTIRYKDDNAAQVKYSEEASQDLVDWLGVKVPLAVEVIKQFEAALQAKREVYPGVTHGWTIRYKDENTVAVKCAEEAHQDLLNWFGRDDPFGLVKPGS